MQAAHLVALYGLGVNDLTADVGLRRLNDAYISSAGAQTIVALVAVALSILLVVRLARRIAGNAITWAPADGRSLRDDEHLTSQRPPGRAEVKRYE